MSRRAAAAEESAVELVGWLPLAQRDPDFGSPERQAVYEAELAALGARRIAWMYEPGAEAAVLALRRRFGLAVESIVPNMRSYLRDASDHGVVGAALHRVLGLPLADKARIALHHVPRAARVLARDFATGVLVIVEMELARFRYLGASSVLLNASVTDLALALDNDRLVRDFVRLAGRTYGCEAGLATYNFGVLVERLETWGVRPDLVAAPFNPRGYLMNPSKEECERALKTAPLDVMATHVEVDGLVARPDALEYLRGLGIRRAMVELGR